MQLSPSPVSSDRLTAYEAQALQLEDTRIHPPEAALHQLGMSLMTELLDVVGESALEDFHVMIGEALIGAFHSVAQRIERDADKARDQLAGLVRDFDGSEVLDTEIQEVTLKARTADVATLAMEIVRDAASATYTTTTGEVWSPWKGSVKATRTTAAQIEARDALRSAKARKHAATNPGATVVAFRAAPQADTAEDAGRIFDALNWAVSNGRTWRWRPPGPRAPRGWRSSGPGRRASPWSWPRPISTGMAGRPRSGPTTRCWSSIRCVC